MTLIIKELIIKGTVSSDNPEGNDSLLNKEELENYFEKMKNEITQECLELIQKNLESSNGR